MTALDTTTDVAGIETTTPMETDRILTAAQHAQRAWRSVPIEHRAQLLRRLAEVLRDNAGQYGELITREMGKPITEAVAEVRKCAVTCEYYADHGPAALADRHVDTPAAQSYVTHEPVGTVLAIMPWNFPFWQVIRFAAPALLAGNAGVVKHAATVSGCALAIEQAFLTAGFPRNLLRALIVDESVVGSVVDGLIADPRIAAVTLTGSNRAGAAVAASAGRAIKKTVLELGGSDPFIVLDDADIPAIAGPDGPAVRSRFLNGGQSCLSAKRFIVEESVADEFERRLAEAVAALRVGDPMDPATQIGPMARPDLVDGIERQVDESVALGARVLAGGHRGPDGCYAPTLLVDVTPAMPVFTEETFGPVAVVIRARDADHAVALAESSEYGLAASIWTADTQRGLDLGARITSGALFVNAVVASDPRMPFGGTKSSGYGRELSAEGIREFTNTRTVWVG
ncbi:NAD-dependent succinate-semialdehyde dehydrogenase [Gordonia sp. NPDC003424]